MKLSLKQEIYRKILHLHSLFVPICYILIDFSNSIAIFTFLFIISLLFDFLRLKLLKDSLIFKRFINKIGIPLILREHEMTRVSGATYLFFASIICIMFADRPIFIIAFVILAISDTAAAVIGKAYGKHKIGNKTLEGALAFFITSIFTAFPLAMLYSIINMQSMIAILLSIIITTFAELYLSDKRLDDNFVIPVVFCLSYSVIFNVI